MQRLRRLVYPQHKYRREDRRSCGGERGESLRTPSHKRHMSALGRLGIREHDRQRATCKTCTGSAIHRIMLPVAGVVLRSKEFASSLHFDKLREHRSRRPAIARRFPQQHQGRAAASTLPRASPTSKATLVVWEGRGGDTRRMHAFSHHLHSEPPVALIKTEQSNGKRKLQVAPEHGVARGAGEAADGGRGERAETGRLKEATGVWQREEERGRGRAARLLGFMGENANELYPAVYQPTTCVSPNSTDIWTLGCPAAQERPIERKFLVKNDVQYVHGCTHAHDAHANLRMHMHAMCMCNSHNKERRKATRGVEQSRRSDTATQRHSDTAGAATQQGDEQGKQPS
jgi:hypothetical protein